MISTQLYPEILRSPNQGIQIVEVFRPDSFHVVLGAGGRPENEVHAEELEADAIPLFKRKGGGGTVLLGPHTLVITVHAGVSHPFGHKIYFKALNRAIILSLKRIKDLDWKERGISDIAVDGRKVIGSSLYRRKDYLLFQASLLVENEVPRMVRYLKHPPRQPDYRQDRDHADFVTCLRDCNITHSWAQIKEIIGDFLPGAVKEEFARLPEAYR